MAAGICKCPCCAIDGRLSEIVLKQRSMSCAKGRSAQVEDGRCSIAHEGFRNVRGRLFRTGDSDIVDEIAHICKGQFRDGECAVGVAERVRGGAGWREKDAAREGTVSRVGGTGGLSALMLQGDAGRETRAPVAGVAPPLATESEPGPTCLRSCSECGEQRTRVESERQARRCRWCLSLACRAATHRLQRIRARDTTGRWTFLQRRY